MKKLLLLGGSKYLLPAIEAAHNIEGGVHVITCDYLPDNVAHKYSDEYHNVADKDIVPPVNAFLVRKKNTYKIRSSGRGADIKAQADRKAVYESAEHAD